MTDPDPDRRSLFGEASGKAAALAIGAIGAAAAAPLAAAAQTADNPDDADILNFALNLEYLETEYYLRGVFGQTLDDAMGMSMGGPVNGGRKVNFSSPVREGILKNITGNEVAHVKFLRSTNDGRAIQRPAIDFEAGFAGVARAAGLPNFDPFASETDYFLGSMLFEDVGVTAYKGAANKIHDKDILTSAAGILASEAYHMGAVRSVLYKMGQEVQQRAAAISDMRDRLDGPQDLDQPIAINGRSNIVPANANGIAYGRTPQHVLNIVYGNPASNILQGGFFPQGVNGRLHST